MVLKRIIKKISTNNSDECTTLQYDLFRDENLTKYNKMFKTKKEWVIKNKTNIRTGVRRVRRYQRGNQNPYIEEEQTTQWPKENVQKLQTIHIKLKIE